ncbi:MAG: hypothetical protein WA584_19405 [Pyrinomonadaceae bacterium]
MIEVTLRNNINNALTAHFGDADWIINQKAGFMSSPTLRRTNFFLKNQAQKAERKLINRGLTITSGRIIAEQTFGFWTDLFEPHHFRLISASPINAFNNLPRGYARRDAARELTKIRKFRNRINHNEPIILYQNTTDFTLVTDIHQSILDVLNWMNPKLVRWIAELDKVSKTILKCQRI